MPSVSSSEFAKSILESGTLVYVSATWLYKVKEILDLGTMFMYYYKSKSIILVYVPISYFGPQIKKKRY